MLNVLELLSGNDVYNHVSEISSEAKQKSVKIQNVGLFVK